MNYKNQEFDKVIANINRNILLEDIKHYTSVLKSKGILLLSGIYNQDVPMIKDEASDNNLEYISFIEKHNWVAVRFQKR
jgi:ribosomal protein L11 methyltransferase